MITQIFQPDNSTSCGQHCIAMILNRSIKEVIELFNHSHSTKTLELITVLRIAGLNCNDRLQRVKKDIAYPKLSILKVKWIRGSHWIVQKDNIIYDPVYGTISRQEYENGILKEAAGRITSYLEIKKGTVG